MRERRRRQGLFATPANIWVMAALVLVMGLLHVTWLPLLSLKPDLMLALIVAWSLERGRDEGLIWAFIGGALLDLLSSGPFGAYTLALLLCAFIAGSVQRVVFGSALLQAAVMAIATFLYHVGYTSILVLTTSAGDLATAARLAWPAVVFNTLLLFILRGPLAWLHRRTETVEMDV